MVLKSGFLVFSLFIAALGGCPPEVEQPLVEEDQAVNTARLQVLFEPESIEAQLNTDQDHPAWEIALRGRLPGQSIFEFELAVVTIDAITGNVLSIDTQ